MDTAVITGAHDAQHQAETDNEHHLAAMHEQGYHEDMT